MKILKPEELKNKTVKDLFSELESSDRGLDEQEARKRLEAYGRNEPVEGWKLALFVWENAQDHLKKLICYE